MISNLARLLVVFRVAVRQARLPSERVKTAGFAAIIRICAETASNVKKRGQDCKSLTPNFRLFCAGVKNAIIIITVIIGQTILALVSLC